MESEVAAATNTKKEIKALVATLANVTKGLIKWGKITGRVKPPTGSKASQTDSCLDIGISGATRREAEEIQIVLASVTKVPSTNKSRFEFMGIVSELKEMIKNQNKVISELVAQMTVNRDQQQKQLQHKQKQS